MPEIIIIPALIVHDKQDLERQLSLVSPSFSCIQLDIMDGIFVENKTGITPKDIATTSSKDLIELHLMIAHPNRDCSAWFETKAKRFIFHIEAVDDPCEIIQKAKRARKEIGFALNPQTPLQTVLPYLQKLDVILCMTVKPGKSGQKFQQSALSKITELRRLWPEGNIEVDGGVTSETAKLALEAGANYLVTGKAVAEEYLGINKK